MYEIEFINNLRPLYPYFQITITITKIIIHKNITPNNRNNYFYELIKFRLTTIMVSIRINLKKLNPINWNTKEGNNFGK